MHGGNHNIQGQHGGDNYSRHGGNYSASQPSIFDFERANGNEEFKNNNMLPDPGNQNVEMSGANGAEAPDNGLSKLDLYHVELTGMCTDQEQSDYTKMLAEFA